MFSILETYMPATIVTTLPLINCNSQLLPLVLFKFFFVSGFQKRCFQNLPQLVRVACSLHIHYVQYNLTALYPSSVLAMKHWF